MNTTPETFAVGTQVKIWDRRNKKWLTGTVTASNALITNVTTYNEVLGRVMVASWSTRGVKNA